MKKICYDDVKNNAEFGKLIYAANMNLMHMGYTEHGLRHVGYVARTTANILMELGFDDRTVELGAMAGYVHDIGNAINRKNHGHTGAILSFDIFTRMGLDIGEIATIIGAVGNHEEETGLPVSPVSAALILADKSDSHRSRVRKKDPDLNDIHDRVNFSIKKNYLAVDVSKRVIRLAIFMDPISSTMEYMQIYLSRIVMCEKAAAFLDCLFELVINGAIINRQKPADYKFKHIPGEKEVSQEESTKEDISKKHNPILE